jgi:xanthine/uracil permease
MGALIMMNGKTLQKTTLETLQWLSFLLASSVAIPIVIGSAYEMSYLEMAGLMQRTLFIVGLGCLLQALIGHKLPIVDGPAGIWISIFIIYAFTAIQSGGDLQKSLRILETVMILTGIILILFGILKLSKRLLSIFTPLVTGSFLFLLTIQLSGTFLESMLGMEKYGELHLGETLISFFVFFFILGFSLFWKGPMKNYAVIIGICSGWAIHLAIDGLPITNSLPMFKLPETFAWGLPKWDIGAVPIAVFTAIILLANQVGSLGAVNYTLKGNSSFTHEQMNRGSFILGVNQGLSAIFSGIAVVTLASTSGFMQLTNQKRLKPFIYASILLTIITFFPPIVSFLSHIPASIASAALLASFVQLMGIGLRSIANEKLDDRKLIILGVSYMIGIGLMFLPNDTFEKLPSILSNLLSNGLLVGTILIILMESLWKERNEEQ